MTVIATAPIVGIGAPQRSIPSCSQAVSEPSLNGMISSSTRPRQRLCSIRRSSRPSIRSQVHWPHSCSYAVGFLARPLGGALFGHFGDRLGRKSMLVLTLFIMGLSTFCIGLLPTYASIGVFAPILLILLRVIQGIGLGGEWGGASLMVLEHAPADNRGFYTSFVQIGFPVGLVLATPGVRTGLEVAGRRFRSLWLAHSIPDQHCAPCPRNIRALPDT